MREIPACAGMTALIARADKALTREIPACAGMTSLSAAWGNSAGKSPISAMPLKTQG
ncbi:hypothetical protein [Brenneria tiliae]|uniref:Uncharacterized protein n=1 Tax=Brenneria tiliae TaxID=2914984 RepID=A0ABT0MT15_9GAMM|nr:hypothetical protein [Brenneria tiliae]MCL2892757.1 hypothetical protein [Brenneria tiliae]MCL2898097.1 hypothetical protein [Brenneria tiliae]MCL2902178.1 hypothetical protein [Brenneria tiliae]